jgi:hypothetical protein
MNTRLSAAHVALASTLVMGALATGCTVQTTAAPLPTGQVTFDWTVDGSPDPNLCAQSSAASFVVEVTDESNGNTIADYSTACTDGLITLTLTQGNYSAQAWLEDSSGAQRTTIDPVSPFTINSAPLGISLDFPSSSFN